MSLKPGPADYSGPATPRKILGGVIGTRVKYEKVEETSPGPARYTPDTIRLSLTRLP